MNTYLWLKTVHIISSTVLFGTGLGIAFFKWIVDRSGNVSAIRVVSERIVLADWLFTAPAIVVQPATGMGLAALAGYPVLYGWMAYAIFLYLAAVACWLPVVWLQFQMRNLARVADRHGEPLPSIYHHYARVWAWFGVPSFLALLAVFWLMVAKPV